MHNSTKAQQAPRCEDKLALDLKGMEARITAGAILSVHWRADGVRRQAQLHMEDDGLRIEYGSSDPDGRWLQCIGTELAAWHFTPLRFGGSRRWLGCPDCGRRCRALYYGDSVLRCRLCLGLNYRSQNMQPAQRIGYRMYQLRKDRLGDERPDLLESCPPRPRGMRRRTYQRLVAMDEALEERRVILVLGRFLRVQ